MNNLDKNYKNYDDATYNADYTQQLPKNLKQMSI